MISPKFFIDTLKQNDIDFFSGVPDSLLKDFCACITDHSIAEKHIIAANEGAAIGLACGYHLATSEIPFVYMQNSGLGNATNPLLSLADKKVYSIPLLLLIGWRGELGIKDEPQHISQGEVTIPMLEAMHIPYVVLSKNEEEVSIQLNQVFQYLNAEKAPYAIIVSKETFLPYKLKNIRPDIFSLSREEAMREILQYIDKKDVVVSTTGMISRELYELRESNKQSHQQDFLTVGSMGHASQIALGIALSKKDRKVFCFDGDGAILMHMGSMAITGAMKPDNYVHVVFNNGAHDSVGGQPTVGLTVNFPGIALSCGYSYVFSVDDETLLRETVEKVKELKGTVLIEVKVRKGARKDLGRPASTPIQNKEIFQEFLR